MMRKVVVFGRLRKHVPYVIKVNNKLQMNSLLGEEAAQHDDWLTDFNMMRMISPITSQLIHIYICVCVCVSQTNCTHLIAKHTNLNPPILISLCSPSSFYTFSLLIFYTWQLLPYKSKNQLRKPLDGLLGTPLGCFPLSISLEGNIYIYWYIR